MTTSNWVIDHFNLQIRDDKGALYVPDATEIFEFIFSKRELINGLKPTSKPTISGNELKFSKFPVDPVIEIELTTQEHSPEMYLSVWAAGNNFRQKIKDFHELTSDHIIFEDTWFPFTKGSLDEIREILGLVGISGVGRITLREYLELKKLSLIKPVIIDTTEISTNAADLKYRAVEPIPRFIGILYPYQEVGLRWLSWISMNDLGCILADEMGLGKTVQAIALLTLESTKCFPSLIISPATILENWRREILKFSPDLRVLKHQGRDRTGFPSDLEDFDVVVTSYDTAVRDLSLLQMISWNILLLDEAQAIRNPLAQRTNSVKNIPRRISLAMTGTPIENYLVDLWSIMDFCVPGYLGEVKSFQRTFTNDLESASRLEPLVSPLMLRRRTEEVAPDLPELIEIPQELIMGETEAEVYEKLREEILHNYENGAALAALTKLRMYCAHPSLLDSPSGNPALSSEKYRRFIEIASEIVENEDKVIVFTSYRQMIDMIQQDIGRRFGLFCAVIDGRTPIPHRQPILDDFSEYSGSSMLVLNPRAAGTGLNIVAANHVIHYNLEWNPAVEMQATKRAHRLGQTRPVTVHRLYYLFSVEEIINQRLERKKAIADTAVIGIEGKNEDYDDIMRALTASPVNPGGEIQ